MDLNQFDKMQAAQDEGTTVEILHPATGEPFMGIVICGPDSDRARKAKAAAAERRVSRRKRGRMTVAQFDEENAQVLADCVLNWWTIGQNVDEKTGQPIGLKREPVELDGKALEPTPPNAFTLFTRFPFIREQAEAGASDRANFMRT